MARPLSPLIFNLLMEPLATHIRAHPSTSGIRIGNTSHKISLFADDVILILTNPASSLAEVQKMLTWFSEISYYKVSISTLNLMPQQKTYYNYNTNSRGQTKTSPT